MTGEKGLKKSKKSSPLSEKIKKKRVSNKSKYNKNNKKIDKNTDKKEVINSKKSITYTNKKVDPKSKWLIIELSEDVTFEEYVETIEQHIIQLFGSDSEYFIPVYQERVQDKVVSLVLFEGYFFIRSSDYITNISNEIFNEYFKGAMRKQNKIVEIPGIKINEFKEEMLEKLKRIIPRKKQRVIPKIGIFSDLEGEVISVDRRKFIATVRFKYTTRIIDAPISIINLKILE